MTEKETAQLEAARSACLAAINATQCAYQTLEVVLGTSDHVEPDKPDWGTFDTDTTKENTTNGKSNKRR